MTACSGSKKEQPKLDYQSQSHRLVKLEVPPDLNKPDQGNLINYRQAAAPSAPATSTNAALKLYSNLPMRSLETVKGVRLERDGN